MFDIYEGKIGIKDTKTGSKVTILTNELAAIEEYENECKKIRYILKSGYFFDFTVNDIEVTK